MSEYKEYGYESAAHAKAHTYIQSKLLGLLDKNRNRNILDVGCGNGAVARFLLERGFNVYGTDASSDGIKIANELNPGRFAIQDLALDDLPEIFSGIQFDTVISTEVIEHLYDPRKFVDFTKKILLRNGGGELIISTPYHGYLKNLALAVNGQFDRHLNPLWDGGHIKFWSRKTLSQLLHERGFVVTQFAGCGRVPYLWKSMLIKARIGKVDSRSSKDLIQVN